MNHVRNLIASEPANWLTILTEQYAISAVRDGDLVSLKYNQIESPMHEPIVQECRGMVVDTARNTILAHPYNKFWNHGEALAAKIDWRTANVLDKLDGSLITLYWNGGWQVASSGHPTAGGSYGEEARTFRDAFWETWHALGMRRPRRAVAVLLHVRVLRRRAPYRVPLREAADRPARRARSRVGRGDADRVAAGRRGGSRLGVHRNPRDRVRGRRTRIRRSPGPDRQRGLRGRGCRVQPREDQEPALRDPCTT
jgi:hypothetical protein